MKKVTAALLGAAVTIGSMAVPVCAAESQTVVSDQILFELTADGDTFTAEITAEYDVDHNTKLSAAFHLPEEALGGEMDIVLKDVVCITEGNTYIHTDALFDLYYELTGDTSITMLAMMAGFDEPWLMIPKIEIPASEETLIPQMSDELAMDLAQCMTVFEMIPNGNTIEIPITGPDTADLLKILNAVGNEHGEELEMLIREKVAAAADIDYKEVFSDYILAAAEGICEAAPELEMDGAKEIAETFVDAFKKAIVFDVNVFGMVAPEDADETFAELKEFLTEDVLSGLVAIHDAGANIELSVTDSTGANVELKLELVSVTEGLYADIAVPEQTVELRDVIKNAAKIYWNMMIPRDAEGES